MGADTVNSPAAGSVSVIIRHQVEMFLDPIVEHAKKQARNMFKPPPFDMLSRIGIPVPDSTFLVDVGGLAGAGVAGRAGFTVAFGNGEAMLLARAGGGGVLPWVTSTGLSLGVSNSPVGELPGTSVQAGGMVEFPQVLSATGEVAVHRGLHSGQTYGSTMIGGAASLPDGAPFAVWGTAEMSTVLLYFSTDRIIDNGYSWWMTTLFGGH